MKYHITFYLTFLALIQVLIICESRRSLTKHRFLVHDVARHDIPFHSHLQKQKRLTSSRAINFGNQGRQSVKDVSARAVSNLARSIADERGSTAAGASASKLIESNVAGKKIVKTGRLRSLKRMNHIEQDRFKRESKLPCDCAKLKSSSRSRSSSNLVGPVTIGDGNSGVPIETALRSDLNRHDHNNPFSMLEEARHAEKPSLLSVLTKKENAKKPITELEAEKAEPKAEQELAVSTELAEEPREAFVKAEDLTEKVGDRVGDTVGRNQGIIEKPVEKAEGKVDDLVIDANVGQKTQGLVKKVEGDVEEKDKGIAVNVENAVEKVTSDTEEKLEGDVEEKDEGIVEFSDEKAKEVKNKVDDTIEKVNEKDNGILEKEEEILGINKDVEVAGEDPVKKVEGIVEGKIGNKVEGDVEEKAKDILEKGEDVAEKLEEKANKVEAKVESKVEDVVEKVEEKKVPTKKIGGKKKKPYLQRPYSQRPYSQRPYSQRPYSQRPQPAGILPSKPYPYAPPRNYPLIKPPPYENLPPKCRGTVRELELKILELIVLMEKLKARITYNPKPFSSPEIRGLLHQIALIRTAADESLIAIKVGNLKVLAESVRLVGFELVRLSSTAAAQKLEPGLLEFENVLRHGYGLYRKACRIAF